MVCEWGGGEGGGTGVGHKNPILDLPNIHPYAKCGQIRSIVLNILSRNEILTSVNGHNSVINL